MNLALPATPLASSSVSLRHTGESERRTMRAISAPRFSMPCRECAQSPWLLIVKSGDFPAEFAKGDGLKACCRFERKPDPVSADFTYHLAFAVRWPSGRRRRFAKVARDHRTGLKFTISGPFFIGSLVSVGCRLVDLAHRARRPARYPETSEPGPLRRPAHLRRPERRVCVLVPSSKTSTRSS